MFKEVAVNALVSAAGSAAAEAPKLIWEVITAKCNSSDAVESDEETFMRAVEELQAIKDDFEMEVKRKKMKTPTSNYKLWLKRVDKILEEGLLQSKRGQYGRRSLKRGVMAKKCVEVFKLLEESKFPRGFLVDKPPSVLKMNAPDIEQFPTLQSSFGKALEALRDDRVKGIGLFGHKGVGKTSIMKNLNNHEEVCKVFDPVIWVEVSMESSEAKLQEDIARRLGLITDDITYPHEVARIIFEELKDKKYLLLLDEVMDFMDLTEIGIPDNNNGGKVVLSTEFQPICCEMAEKMITVGKLTPDEEWKMFRDIVIDVINIPDIIEVAQQVANECSRLPLMIRTVAGFFKSKDSYSEWKIGLEGLRNGRYRGLEKLDEFLNFCYKQLKDDGQKKCFLYSALYPGDTKIYTSYLLECLAIEGFLGNIDERSTLQDACHKGFDILKHLTNISLLEKGERMTYVQMNKYTRNVALTISSQDPSCKFLVETSEQSANDWPPAKRISKIDSRMCTLPEYPTCKLLLSLLLQRNSDLVTIPSLFFEHMRNLLVLDLAGTGIESLPLSVSMLTGLKSLYLNDCTRLTELPPQVGALRQLEVLDIRGCKVSFIPIHIQKLVHLRRLRVSYYKRIVTNGIQEMEISGGVISKLSRLEELIINVDDNSYARWCNEAADVIHQVATLTSLCNLRICFPNSKILRMFMDNSPSWRDCQKLSSFRFFVGCKTQKHPEILEYFQYKIDRYLKYCDQTSKCDSLACDFLAETNAFELSNHSQISTLSDFAGIANLHQVRGCCIKECEDIQTIVDSNKTACEDILPSLEQLRLYKLMKMQCIFDGSMSGTSLSRLQTLIVIGCPMLTKLFSNGMIQQLQQLQYLKVSGCPKIESLIMQHEALESELSVLPNLETLKLHKLPQLKAICSDNSSAWHSNPFQIFGSSGSKVLAWPSLKFVEISRCHKLKAIPFSGENAPKLKSIKGEKAWLDALKWQDVELRNQLPFAASG